MESEELELPYLPKSYSFLEAKSLPASYMKFQQQAKIGLSAISKEDEQLSISGDVEDDSIFDNEMPPEVTDALRSVSETKENSG